MDKNAGLSPKRWELQDRLIKLQEEVDQIWESTKVSPPGQLEFYDTRQLNDKQIADLIENHKKQAELLEELHRLGKSG